MQFHSSAALVRAQLGSKVATGKNSGQPDLHPISISMATITYVPPAMHDCTIPMETCPEAIRRTDSLGSVPQSVWYV